MNLGKLRNSVAVRVATLGAGAALTIVGVVAMAAPAGASTQGGPGGNGGSPPVVCYHPGQHNGDYGQHGNCNNSQQNCGPTWNNPGHSGNKNGDSLKSRRGDYPGNKNCCPDSVYRGQKGDYGRHGNNCGCYGVARPLGQYSQNGYPYLPGGNNCQTNYPPRGYHPGPCNYRGRNYDPCWDGHQWYIKCRDGKKLPCHWNKQKHCWQIQAGFVA